MAYTLPPLPYAFDAMEPYIDARTMEIHHDKHHAAYVTNVNKALEGNALGAAQPDHRRGPVEHFPIVLQGRTVAVLLPGPAIRTRDLGVI